MMNKKNGFTLIEMVMVIFLIAIVSNSIMHSYDQSGPSLELARRKVATDIRFAQSRAMTTKTIYGFRALSTSSYEIYQGSPGNPVTDPATGTSMVISLGEKFGSTLFASDSYQFSFDSSGMPNIASNLSLTLEYGASSKNIEIFSGSGAVILP